MHLVRYMFFCIVVAVVFAVGMNGVAMAANDVGHQAHCIDTFGENSPEVAANHGHEHTLDHSKVVAQHTAPDHDHDTCVIHPCPALSAGSIKLGKLEGTFLNKLSWPDQPLLALERADGLKRPPKF